MMKTTIAFLFLLSSALAFGAADEVETQPFPLKANEYRVGERVPNLDFTDIDDKKGSLNEYWSKKALVIALSKVDCPICQKYAPRLVQLEKEYAGKDVAFLMVNVGKDSIEKLKAAISHWGFTARYLPDYENQISNTLRALTSGEVFVLDKTRTLRYRGPIDDQYLVGQTMPQPKRHFLRAALDAVLGDAIVEKPAISAPGCALNLKAFTEPAQKITYHNQIARVIQTNCQTCHRPNESAPFALMSYSDAKDHARMMSFVVKRGLMPPWSAHPKHGDWANDRSMSARHRDWLVKWVEEGMAEGDASETPLPIKWPEGWSLGVPDQTFSVPQPFKVPAEGIVPYQYVTVPTNLTEDKWISSFEIHVTQPQVVHHVVVLVKVPGEPGQSALEGVFAVRVPGNYATKLPDDMGRLLPKGSQLKFQIHYTPNGVAVEDTPTIGFRYAKKKPLHDLAPGGVSDTKFVIPANDPNFKVVATKKFSKRTHLLSLMPHMHVRGKAYKVERVSADGTTSEVLLDVPKYDFNWQHTYWSKQPIIVEAGESLRATASYDNSAGNPANPNPDVDVKYGEQTFEEMMIVYFDAY